VYEAEAAEEEESVFEVGEDRRCEARGKKFY